ncbi:hypothetical protein [Curtobacterium sp. 24E2]
MGRRADGCRRRLLEPLVTVPIPGQVWAALQILVAALFIVVGIAVKVPREADAPRAS